jgi:hypothetical protein
MKKGKTYDEYLQSDWYKNHLEKKMINKNSKIVSLDVKDRLYQKVKRYKIFNHIKSNEI